MGAKRIAVMGESVGGGLAAKSHTWQKRREARVSCPCSTIATSSFDGHVTPFLTHSQMDHIGEHFLVGEERRTRLLG